MNHRFLNILTLFFLLICLISKANSIDYQKNIDTLEKKSFKELKQLFYETDDDSLQFAIASYTLIKAKEKENYVAIANSYQRLYRSVSDFNLGEKYLDSSISISKEKKLKKILAESYFYKGYLNQEKNKYNLALKYYILANDHFENLGNKDWSDATRFNIGILKLRVGKSEEALQIFKECLTYNKKNNKPIDLDLLSALSSTYSNINQLDSSSEINRKAYNYAKSIESPYYYYFIQIEGVNKFKKKEYNAAKDSLIKSIQFFKNQKDHLNLSNTYFFLSSAHQSLNQEDKAIHYLKKIDSIFDSEGIINFSSRYAYVELIEYFKKKGDLKNRLYYIEKLLEVDNVFENTFGNLDLNLYKNYDTPKLLKERENIIKELKSSNTGFMYGSILLFILLLSAFTLLIYNRNKRKKYEQKFQELLRETQKQQKELPIIKSQDSNSSKNLEIKQEVITLILDRLVAFEEKEHYLQKRITLASLAKEFETNSRYLSKVVNHYKEKDFRTYLNDLRIDYTINRIKNDPIFRKYTIYAIADEVGFSNQESYAKAFYKRTGIHTSFFIKRLNNL
ncbi:AraC family transcriptional regulator [Kordia jejudonensis]|uniref:AraC family transcriptional regulator n=1 Tax=Kordia jejudonensis TaxID=1348245 RepID=UPI00062939FB|nr:AraC family transcriptional regulator [Kordia jejudonensis]